MTFTNSRKVRIEWGDCDPAGIIFYPTYFEIFDASVTALFERALGMSKLEQMKRFGLAGYPPVKTRARFLRPTRFGDDVTVETKIDVGGTSFDVEHRLSLGDTVCVECAETRVWMARDAETGALRPSPVPDEVKARFGA
jgi:4-hydroxybenzoyl-CoA thioesterase